MRQLRNDEVRADELYCVAYLPGLSEYRWGIYWTDGIADRVPGYLVQRAIGAVSPLAVFEMGARLAWQNKRPVIVERKEKPARRR